MSKVIRGKNESKAAAIALAIVIQDLEKRLANEKKNGDIADLPHEEVELFSKQVSTRACVDLNAGYLFDKLCNKTQIAVELGIALQLIPKLGGRKHEYFSEPVRIAIDDLLRTVKTLKNNLEEMDKVKQDPSARWDG